MRQANTNQRGAIGETAVSLAFQRLGWGVATVPTEHDLGIDLLALVRDERMFDLSRVLAVQVKAGDSYFGSPRRDEGGEIEGWWFYDAGRRHIDGWIAHVLPHIVVLYDVHDDIAYWEHVSRDTVVSTGAGAKIFVPRANVIDQAHRNQLTEVAVSGRPAPTWEGSVWANPGRIAPRDLLRHALLTPRLVAPHRNAGTTASASVEQVVALLVEARLRDVDRLAGEAPGSPAREEASASPDWAWRFVGALRDRLTTGGVETLVSAAEEAPTPEARAAAGLIELARADEAAELIQVTLADDEMWPVDHAWLTVQHARACLEIGRVEDANASAASAYVAGRERPDDLTAAAIAGAAGALMFNRDSWTTGELGQVLANLDNTVGWWRSQRQSAGATAVVEREFDDWTRDRRITFKAEDEANNRLFTAALLASLLGDHGAWKKLASLNAKQALLSVTRFSDPGKVRGLLNDLRLSGDHKALGKAVRRLVDDGPSSAVTACAAEIDFAHWTRTTSHAHLTLLNDGGDVLDAETSRAAVEWLLTTLRAPEEFVTRVRPHYSLPDELVKVLAGVTTGACVADGRTIVDRFLAEPVFADELLSRAWLRVLYAVPADVWEPALVDGVVRRTARDRKELRLAALGLAVAQGDATATEQLLELIRQGSEGALVALGDFGLLSPEVAAVTTELVGSHVAQIVANARQGVRAHYVHKSGPILAILNLEHPDSAHWDPVYDLLDESAVSPKDKNSVCTVLARRVHELPNDVRSRLRSIAESMIDHPVRPTDDIQHARERVGPAAVLAANTGGGNQDGARLLDRALAGGPDDRAWVPLLTLALPVHVAAGVLAVLAHDESPWIRLAAASCVVKLVLDGHGNEHLEATLCACAQDPGVSVRLAVAEGLNRADPEDQTIADIRQTLMIDLSAGVRAAAKAIGARMSS